MCVYMFTHICLHIYVYTLQVCLHTHTHTYQGKRGYGRCWLSPWVENYNPNVLHPLAQPPEQLPVIQNVTKTPNENEPMCFPKMTASQGPLGFGPPQANRYLTGRPTPSRNTAGQTRLNHHGRRGQGQNRLGNHHRHLCRHTDLPGG